MHTCIPAGKCMSLLDLFCAPAHVPASTSLISTRYSTTYGVFFATSCELCYQLQSSQPETISKYNENSTVMTHNCNKETIIKQETEQRNSSRGSKYRYKSFRSSILTITCKLITLQLSFTKLVGWSTKKKRFQ